MVIVFKIAKKNVFENNKYINNTVFLCFANSDINLQIDTKKKFIMTSVVSLESHIIDIENQFQDPYHFLTNLSIFQF